MNSIRPMDKFYLASRQRINYKYTDNTICFIVMIYYFYLLFLKTTDDISVAKYLIIHIIF